MWDASQNMVAELGGSKNELDVEDNGVINYDCLDDNRIESHREMEVGEDKLKRNSLKSFVEHKRQQKKDELGRNSSTSTISKLTTKYRKLRDTASGSGSKRTADEGYNINALEPITESNRKVSAAGYNDTSVASEQQYKRMEKSNFERTKKASSVINSLENYEKEFKSKIVSLYGFDKLEGYSVAWPNESIVRVQPLTADNNINNLTYGKSSGQLALKYLLTLGLPILCCLIFLIIIWRVFKYFTKIRDATKKEKTKLQEPQVVIDVSDKILRTFQPKIDSIKSISNGKQVFKTSLQPIDQENKHCKLEVDQLSISMDQEVTSNDSDEPNEWRRTLTKKLIEGLKMNMPKKKKKNSSDNDSNNQQEPLDGNGTSNETGECSTKLGKIKYSISYDFSKTTLSIGIIEAANLPGLDLCGLSDPYVKVYFEQDKRYCEKTRVHKNTLNPNFNEKFEFNIPYSELTSKTLVLALFDFDKFSKHDQIGQVVIPMNSIDLAQTHEKWRDLARIASISNREKVSLS